MIRLGISVEGKTERLFVNKALRSHLLPFGVDATGVDIRGNVSLDKIRGVLPPGFDSYACKALILFDRILKNAPTAVLAAAAGLAYLFLGHGSPYSVR